MEKLPGSLNEFFFKAPSKQRRLSAVFNCSFPGFVGNGKLTTLSMCMAFNCRSKSSAGFRQISGSLNASN